MAAFDVEKTGICGYTVPALTPDGRYVVGVYEVLQPKSHVNVIVFDSATGRSTTTPDNKQRFGTSLAAVVSFSKEPLLRVCIRLSNSHAGWDVTEYPWLLGASGTISSITQPPSVTQPTTASYHVFGSEITRALSAD
jgi:hypothetical protein